MTCTDCRWLRTRWRCFRHVMVCSKYQRPAARRCLDYTPIKIIA